MQRPSVLFDKSATGFILDTFGLEVDNEGYIVEKGNPKQRVLSRAEDEILAKEFAGMKRGSLLFFKSDLPSLIQLADCLP